NSYACFQQLQPTQEPNITKLLQEYAISDRTFELEAASSWVGHLMLVAGTSDGFLGIVPSGGSGSAAFGWGCDSNKVAPWGPNQQPQPSCVPDYALDPQKYPYGGAFRTTPVSAVPTIMDELTSANLS